MKGPHAMPIQLLFLLALVVLGGSIITLLNIFATTDRFVTKVQTGGFKFLVKGESLYRILDNVSGHFVNQNTHKVVPDNLTGPRRPKGILERTFGIIWISWFWPLKKVHEFEVVADKIKEGDSGTATIPVRQRIQVELRPANYLRHRFNHPVLVTDVELGGGQWKVDIIVMLDIVVINPAIVVFDYKGKVMRAVDAAVSSAVMDYWNKKDMTYQEFVRTEKGPTTDFANYIRTLNSTTAPGPQNDGLTDRFGVEISGVWIEIADLSPEQRELDNAARSVEQKKLMADARVEEARGEMAFEKMKKEGIALGYQAMMKSFIDMGASPDKAAEMVQEHIRTSNIASATNLQTYVEGGGNVQPTIPVK